MTPEAQRVAIALAVGWKWEQPFNARKSKNTLIPPTFRGPFSTVTVWRGGGFGGEHNLPNYPSDLNAMHEAEEYAVVHLMDADQWANYARHIESLQDHTLLTGPTITCEHDLYYEAAGLLHATAAQRAEAFLRTLNLWTE